MEINAEIFKAYDIRGKYPEEINERVAFLLGKSFVKFLKQKLKKNDLKIIVGRDGRISSPKLFNGIKNGILQEKVNLIDIGLSTSPMLYWAFFHYQFDGGIEITASHLGKEFNGLKLLAKKIGFLSKDSGLEEIKKICLKEKYRAEREKGKLTKKNVLMEYLKFQEKFFPKENFQKLKIVVDTSNSVPGILIDPFKKIFQVKIFHLFPKIDGNFPNHEPDPSIEKNLIFLKKEVKKRKAHLGVIFDGDGDRIVFIDDRGKKIPGDLILAILAKSILKEKPKEKILYDVRCSNIVKEKIEEFGGIPVISRIGHSFIKQKMIKEKILFGGEFSGHYYHRDHYFSEVPLFVFLKILEIISLEKKPISKIIKGFQKYFHTGEINLKIPDPELVIEKLEKKYKRGKILKIDGLRVDFRDWWFLVRPSKTEPVLRLIVEAKTKKLMNLKKKELMDFLLHSS